MDQIALDAFMINWMSTHDHGVLPGAMLMKYGPEDYIGATLAVRATLYFHGSHTDAVREAICQCFDRYEAIAKAHLTWLWREEPPEGSDRYAYPKAKPMRDMLKRIIENDAVSFAYTGGKKPHDASPWLFYVSGLRCWEVKQGGNGLDSLQFSVPRQFVEQNPMVFQSLFIEFARLLKAEHGHGGFAFNLSIVRKHANQSTEAVMVSKMAGLDAGSAVSVAGHARIGITNHIKTVGWLTAINTAMVDAVGGVATLRSALPRDWFAKYDYGNGIVIQAGPEPEVASVEVDAKPAIYVLPNMALKTIRVEKIDSLHQGSMDGEPRLSGVAAERWLQRFDVPDDELLLYQAKLLNEPKLTPVTILPSAL
jgi:hypothetical protein